MLTSKSVELDRSESTESTQALELSFEERIPIQKLEEKIFENLSLWAKVKLALYTIRTEIVAFSFVFFFIISDSVVSNLLLEKACSVNLNYPDYICNNLSNANKTGQLLEAENASQKIVASIGVWKPAVESAIPIIIVLFMGAWSDRHGRKLCMLFTLLGFILKHLGLLLSVMMTSWTAQAVVLAGSIPVGVTGSIAAMTMSLNNYIIDHTSLEKRTFRIGTVNACCMIAISLGMSTGGTIMKAIGYVGLFGMSTIGEILCFLYVIFFINDIKRPKDNACRSLCAEVVNNFSDVFKTLTKKRKNNNTVKLILMILVLFLAFWPQVGENSILYLFTQKKLDWDVQEFGYYNAFSLCFIVFGSFATMGIMVYKLKLADEIVGMAASLSSIASNLWLAGVTTAWMMYIGPVIGVASGAVLFVCRAMPTKVVEHDEVGKVNGAVAMMESLAPLIASPIYSAVYYATFNTFAGATFLLTAVTGVLPLSIYIWLYITKRREAKHHVHDIEKHPTTVEKTRF